MSSHRKDIRENIEIEGPLELYSPTKSKKYSAVVVDESENGVGCFFVGQDAPDVGEEVFSSKSKQYSIQWVQNLQTVIHRFGLFLKK